MEPQFKVFRALGLAFKAWRARFVPITLIAAVLYAPVFVWLRGVSIPIDDLRTARAAIGVVLFHGACFVFGMSALVAPLITYAVIQYMNGAKASIWSSLRFGGRGVLAVLTFSIMMGVLSFVPFAAVVTPVFYCIWFVAGPAAVAERSGPFTAIWRSSVLTNGSRWRIFGLAVVMLVAFVAVWFVTLIPGSHRKTDPAELAQVLRHATLLFLILLAVSQVLMAIVQAVVYSLLRTDKDGVLTSELAKVFE